MGTPAALSVVAAEANSPDFFSKDGNTDVFDVADVYTSANEAMTDFPMFKDPKFASCVARVQGPAIVSTDKNDWPSGTTFGAPVASVTHLPKYGNESGLVEVQTPVPLPGEPGNSKDF